MTARTGTCAIKLAGERLSASSRRHPVYRAALRLIVNALCYVAAYPDDIDTVWPDGASPRLKHKALFGRHKEQKRAKSKLEALGYVPVHICGQQLASQLTTQVSPATGLRHVTTHWRRGHWRNQAFGPARSLRKFGAFPGALPRAITGCPVGTNDRWFIARPPARVKSCR